MRHRHNLAPVHHHRANRHLARIGGGARGGKRRCIGKGSGQRVMPLR
jgi:hypothetical protein